MIFKFSLINITIQTNKKKHTKNTLTKTKHIYFKIIGTTKFCFYKSNLFFNDDFTVSIFWIWDFMIIDTVINTQGWHSFKQVIQFIF